MIAMACNTLNYMIRQPRKSDPPGTLAQPRTAAVPGPDDEDYEYWAPDADGKTLNKEEVQQAVVECIKSSNKYRHLFQPAFHSILTKHGIEHFHKVRYTSNNIAIDYLWGNIKQYLGRGENDQYSNRTMADVMQLHYDKLFKTIVRADGTSEEPVPSWVWFEHVYGLWNDYIAKDGYSQGTIGDMQG
jgi:hypothetical protein